MGSDTDTSRRKHRRTPSDVDDSEGEFEAEKSSKRHKHRHHHHHWHRHRHHRHRSKRQEEEADQGVEDAPPPPPPVLIVSNRDSNRAVDDDVEEGEILEEDGDTEFLEGKIDSRNLVIEPENTGAEVRNELISRIGPDGDANTDIGQDHLKEDKRRYKDLKGSHKWSRDPYSETTGGDESKPDDWRKLSSSESDGAAKVKTMARSPSRGRYHDEVSYISRDGGRDRSHSCSVVEDDALSNGRRYHDGRDSRLDGRDPSRDMDREHSSSYIHHVRGKDNRERWDGWDGERRSTEWDIDRKKRSKEREIDREMRSMEREIDRESRSKEREIDRERRSREREIDRERRIREREIDRERRIREREIDRERRREKEQERTRDRFMDGESKKEERESWDRDMRRMKERERSWDGDVDRTMRREMEWETRGTGVDRDHRREKERDRNRDREFDAERRRERECERSRDKEELGDRRRGSDESKDKDRIRTSERDRYREKERENRDRYKYSEGDRNRKPENDRERECRSDRSRDRPRDIRNEKEKRDEDEQDDFEERIALKLAEQEEEDINRIKEESRKRRQAILEKYQNQQQEESQPEIARKVNEGAESISQSIPFKNVAPETLDEKLEDGDAYDVDPSFSVKKSPQQNGVQVSERISSTAGLGEGTPKSERSDEKYCDDIFGETPARVRKMGKGEGLLLLNSGIHDNWDDADGYYSYRFGEILDGRYEISAAHGKGVFSAVVRAKDLKACDGEPEEVAIKIIRNNETMNKAGKNEVEILQKLSQADPENRRHCVRFLSSFKYRNHLCLIFESLHMNLREVLKKFGRNIGLRLTAVRAYAKQLFIALKHLKSCGILHCDIKPDNMLVNEAKNVLKLCDFGNAMSSGKNEVTPYLVSRFYRAPEIILGLPYDHPMDMWSVGCCLYELYTGKVLFPGPTNNDMLRLHMELKGPFPKKMLKKGAFVDQHFDLDLNFHSTEEDPVTKKTIKRLILNIKPKDISSIIASYPGEDPKLFGNFKDLLEKIFVLDPDRRMTVSQALAHPFVTGK